ncbi:MAG: O-antigen ligase family protein [Balneolaceae bacterium]
MNVTVNATVNGINSKQTGLAVLFLLPFFLYEDLLLAAGIFAAGLLLIHVEKMGRCLSGLQWREYLFFLYMFHMLFGERSFAYLGLEPIFVTEIVLAALVFAYRRELLQVHKNLFIYYILVAIGLLWAVAYLPGYGISAMRDSLMLVYAIWVPVAYHVFRGRRGYDLFFNLVKLFIVLKAAAYLYEGSMILSGQRDLMFEGFRFNVGYVLPSLIVVSLFLPFRHLGLRYKLLSLVMLPAVFTLFHRSIFLGIALALVFIFFTGSAQIRKTILTYGTVSLVLLTGFLVYYNTQIEADLFRILERKSSADEGNISYRFLSWETVLEKYRDYPLLGYGVGRPVMYVQDNEFYDTIDMDYFDARDLGGNAQPHNSYLNILTRFGMVLFPLFLYALWKPAERTLLLVRGMHPAGERYNRLLLLGGMLILMYVFAFFNVVLESPHHAFPFWLTVAMVLAYGHSHNSPPEKVRLRGNDVSGALNGSPVKLAGNESVKSAGNESVKFAGNDSGSDAGHSSGLQSGPDE